jgi:hypothetical protein
VGDGYIAALTADGTAFTLISYIGGTSYGDPDGIPAACDRFDSVVVTGIYSFEFCIPNSRIVEGLALVVAITLSANPALPPAALRAEGALI